LLSKSSKDVPVYFVHGRLYIMWRIKPAYRGVYALEEHGEGYFYPHGWQHDVWIGPSA
jgi:hypothetical protein